jgi:putative oxidoreductase
MAFLRPHVLRRVLEPRADIIYAVLRIVSGLMFTFHGVQKLFGVFTPFRPAFGTQPWLGGLIELVCGLAIALGFQTRIAAFIASGEMAVAYIQFHWRFDFSSGFFPAVNKGELAALYSFLFLFIAARGAGPLSIDGRR